MRSERGENIIRVRTSTDFASDEQQRAPGSLGDVTKSSAPVHIPTVSLMKNDTVSGKSHSACSGILYYMYA